MRKTPKKGFFFVSLPLMYALAIPASAVFTEANFLVIRATLLPIRAKILIVSLKTYLYIDLLSFLKCKSMWTVLIQRAT